jgi:hypothetical protein
MRLPLGIALPLLAALAVAADPPADKDKAAPRKGGKGPREGWALAVGKDLPGPFHPYYVSGPYLDKLREQNKSRKKIFAHFHCPVCDHGLEPIVLVFVREVRADADLKELLKRLEAAAEKNPTARLAVTAVFVADDLKDVVTNDDTREELAGKLEDLAAELKLKKVALCLDGAPDLEKYELDRDVAYTVVLARKYQVVYSQELPRNGLTAEAVNAILDEVAQKLGARKK